MFRKLQLSTSILAVTSFFLLTGYDSCDPIIENNGFDLWCGDELCTWDLEKGNIERVPTWHGGDYGVRMVGDEVSISQLRDIDSTEVGCLRFDLVIRADLDAEIYLELDFYGDGNTDFSERIPSSDWASVSYQVPLPSRYQGIVFRVRKQGPGDVVLAQIYADDASGCGGTADLANRPNGAWCATGDECASALCSDPIVGSRNTCNTCTADTDCADGMICGAAKPDLGPHLELYRACISPGQRGFGERCASDSDCAGGLCHDSQCSACASDADCGDGIACGERAFGDRPELNQMLPYPHQCGPFDGVGEAGTPCLVDQDCASGACTGTGDLHICEVDGRTCDDGDDCPDDLACRRIGVAGGVCQ